MMEVDGCNAAKSSSCPSSRRSITNSIIQIGSKIRKGAVTQKNNKIVRRYRRKHNNNNTGLLPPMMPMPTNTTIEISNQQNQQQQQQLQSSHVNEYDEYEVDGFVVVDRRGYRQMSSLSSSSSIDHQNQHKYDEAGLLRQPPLLTETERTMTECSDSAEQLSWIDLEEIIKTFNRQGGGGHDDENKDEESTTSTYSSIDMDINNIVGRILSQQKAKSTLSSRNYIKTDGIQKDINGDGIPKEVVIISENPNSNNDATTPTTNEAAEASAAPEADAASMTLDDDEEDVQQQPQQHNKRLVVNPEAEVLVQSYYNELQSTKSLADSLYKYLNQTQTYAEDLLDQNALLKTTMEEMEQDEIIKNDVFTVLKTIMGLTLTFYLFGGNGSESYLAGSVAFYLLAEVIFACI